MQQELSWSLSEIENVYYNRIYFDYNKVENKVGSTSGKYHTEASYLSNIRSDLGAEVDFIYSTKNSNEYYEPNISQLEPDAYQERYEKKYLNRVDHYNNDGIKLSATHFEYQMVGSGETYKRLLKKVYPSDINGYSSPGTTFTYNTTTPDLLGKITSIENPSGGTISYTYHSGLYPSNSYRNKTISAPNGYNDPRIYFGSDYAVVAWRQTSNGSITNNERNVKVYVYTWKGYWKEEYKTTISKVRHYEGNWERFHVALGENFFGIGAYYSNSSGMRYQVKLYHRNKGNDSWSQSTHYEYTGAENSDQGWGSRPRFRAGSNFVALIPFHKREVYTYVLKGDNWIRKVINRGVDGWYNTGVANNYIVDHQRHGSDRVKLYYLDEMCNWQTRTVTTTLQTDHEDHSYWHPTSSYATVLADDNSELIYTWDHNYNNMQLHSPFGAYDDRSNVFNTANSSTTLLALVVRNNVYNHFGKSVRFNGSSFISSGQMYGYSLKSFSLGQDYILRDKDNLLSTKQCLIKRFDANTGSWKSDISFSYSGGTTQFKGLSANPLQANTHHALIFNKLYTIDNRLNFTATSTLQTPSNERIYAPSTKGGKDFYIYPIEDPTWGYLGHQLQFVKNGVLSTNIRRTDYFKGWHNLAKFDGVNTESKTKIYVSRDMYVSFHTRRPFENNTSLILHKISVLMRDRSTVFLFSILLS